MNIPYIRRDQSVDTLPNAKAFAQTALRVTLEPNYLSNRLNGAAAYSTRGATTSHFRPFGLKM